MEDHEGLGSLCLMKNRNWVQAILTFMFSALSEDWKGRGGELMKRALRYHT